ncbi:TerC/Alx family metal homeostasis membrane protein [Elizabethkingia sp. JS20170427COW]|uniref:TerC/Alx family metal homeostasis membrane protein n=1 Tax=Elizabethkingia sp. JS20170427COW TaxID=2583851 RepID=UPI0011108E50|nr:TerC/Alx family metal homeostasis membrane protein [Elizabethkingia sp. JS20170427COW]QCX54243.1 TerC/Alx family metal homeostasis membrane protein [Elizabethkingia sp. JS20170427COW]
MTNEFLFLLGFLLIVGFILVVDLGLITPKKKVETEVKDDPTLSLKHAGLMSFFVICVALGFYVFLMEFGHNLHNIHSIEHLQEIITKRHHPVKIIPGDLETSLELYNHNLALEYITGYIVEYALSVDNIFVILMLFTSFKVDPKNYHKVLLWGILGAIALRFVFIFVGASLISKFGWIMYVFGAFLLFTGIKMFVTRNQEEHIDPEHHPVVKFANKYFKVHNKFVDNKFFVVIDGVKKMTPLFLVLLIIEFTDLIFAVDSIPAIFSITKDPYVVFFSNIFAIIGLRSMFFLLAGIVDKFKYLKVGLAALLSFIGLKMLFHHQLDDWGFKTTDSLFIILGILTISIVASLLSTTMEKQKRIKKIKEYRKNR